MRSISLVVMMLSLRITGCTWSRSDECVQTFGVDEVPPREVLDFINKKMNGHRLVDRVDCVTETMWVAIPEGVPVDSPRNPGVGTLIRLDKKTRQIDLSPGE